MYKITISNFAMLAMWISERYFGRQFGTGLACGPCGIMYFLPAGVRASQLSYLYKGHVALISSAISVPPQNVMDPEHCVSH